MVTRFCCGWFQLHAEADAELQLQFKLLMEKRKANVARSATFALPTGNQTFVKLEGFEWDGSDSIRSCSAWNTIRARQRAAFNPTLLV